MGRILDVLRRKRSQPSSSPRSGEICYASSPVNSNSLRDEEIDKENEKPAAKGNTKTDYGHHNPFYNAQSLTSFDGYDSKEEDNFLDLTQEMKIDDHVKDSRGEMNLGVVSCEETQGVDSIDEFTEMSDEIALASVSESEHSSDAAAAVSVSEVTELSDDGILRDDEGNPIDPNEAEENMLRDDEGNIIDPKTLVRRDSFVDELLPCIAEQGRLPTGDDSKQSEEEADSGLRVIHLHEDSFPSRVLKNESPDDWYKEPPIVKGRDEENCKNAESKVRRTAFLRRRKRRDQRAFSMGSDEYVHIIFHNKLSTLEEESWSNNHSTTSSADDADNESFRSLHSRKSMSLNGSFDEKFIRARWEYSLQVMNSGSHVNSGALIDARDEINVSWQLDVFLSLCHPCTHFLQMWSQDMLRPTNAGLDDCSVELETGEI